MPTGARVEVVQDNTRQIKKNIDLLLSKELLVGIPAKNNMREGAPFGNAAIGYINEKGSPVNNIPPRPHLVPGIKAVQSQIVVHLREAGIVALKGKKESDVLAEFSKAGSVAQSSVVATIRNVIPPPLAPSTIAARRRKGHAGSTPLVMSGAYVQSITYVIRNKGT